MGTATAGYKAQAIITGASTAMTDEAMSLSSGKLYYTTNAAKNLWDPTATFVVEDNASVVATTEYTLDPLLGTVEFDSGYTITGAITVTGNYLVQHVVGKARGASLTVTRNELDTTVFGEESVDRIYGLLDITGTLERLDWMVDVYDGGTETYFDIINDGTYHVLEINWDTDSDRVWRMFGMLSEAAVQAAVDGLNESNHTFMGALWDDGTIALSVGDPTA